MWDKLLEFGQQLLTLKGQVRDNTSDLTELKKKIKRLGSGTHKLLNKIKLIKQQHAHEMQLTKETHAAQIQRLEEQIRNLKEQIHHLKENYDDALEKSNMSTKTQILEVMNQHLQGQLLVSGLVAKTSENSPEKRITGT